MADVYVDEMHYDDIDDKDFKNALDARLSGSLGDVMRFAGDFRKNNSEISQIEITDVKAVYGKKKIKDKERVELTSKNPEHLKLIKKIPKEIIKMLIEEDLILHIETANS